MYLLSWYVRLTVSNQCNVHAVKVQERPWSLIKTVSRGAGSELGVMTQVCRVSKYQVNTPDERRRGHYPYPSHVFIADGVLGIRLLSNKLYSISRCQQTVQQVSLANLRTVLKRRNSGLLFADLLHMTL